MGAFVLGILVGWLAEWVFYTYWVKGGENDENCASLKDELELKNRQISSLQSQLSATKNDKSTTSKASKKTSAVSKAAATKARSTSKNYC